MTSRTALWLVASVATLATGCGGSLAPAARTSAPLGAPAPQSPPAGLEALVDPEEGAPSLERCETRLLDPSSSPVGSVPDRDGKRRAALRILPGETLCIVDLRSLTLASAPTSLRGGGLGLTLQSSPSGAMLFLRSGQDRVLTYHARIGLRGEDGVRRTSTCPVHPGALITEMWPQPLAEIILSDFTLHEPPGPSSCE